MKHENRMDNEENNIGLHERELRDKALAASNRYGRLSTQGRVPVRIDNRTVIYKKVPC
jgi:hypothetical protein